MGLKRYRCLTLTRTTPTIAEGQRIVQLRGQAMESDAAVAERSEIDIDHKDLIEIVHGAVVRAGMSATSASSRATSWGAFVIKDTWHGTFTYGATSEAAKHQRSGRYSVGCC